MRVPRKKRRAWMKWLASSSLSGTGRTREGENLTKTLTFKGFEGAVGFVNRVAEAASAATHPARYKSVRIVLTTHVAHGLTDADVQLARRTDALERP